jgi:DNA polymerase-4
MADDVWAWCEKSGARGRTVTVKIKWADFQQSSRSQSLVSPVDSRARLHEASLGLIRSVLPAAKGVRLVGVTLSNFGGDGDATADLIDLALPLEPDVPGAQGR